MILKRKEEKMGKVYKRKDSKFYWIEIMIDGERQRFSTHTDDKDVATQILKAKEGDIARGIFDISDTKPSIKFKTLVKEYMKYAKVNKRSWRTDYGRLKRVLPTFGNMRLKEISPFHIEKFKHILLEEGRRRSTTNRYLALIKHIFFLGMKWRMTKVNPVKDVRFFKEKNRKLRYLEEEEIPLLISNCCSQLKPLITTAVYTGMRQGELFNLKFSAVDFKNNEIYVEDSKSGDSRYIPMNNEVRKVLYQLKQKSNHEYVFLNRFGRPFKDVRTAFKTALNRSVIKNFRFHDLRHTFGSHLAMAGVPLLTIKELMGHKTTQITERYAHLSRSHKAAAVETFLRRVQAAQKSLHVIDTFSKKGKKKEKVNK